MTFAKFLYGKPLLITLEGQNTLANCSLGGDFANYCGVGSGADEDCDNGYGFISHTSCWAGNSNLQTCNLVGGAALCSVGGVTT
jgi:hypothetical protein